MPLSYRRSAMGQLSVFEERVVNRVIRDEQKLLASVYAATSAGPLNQVEQKRSVGTALLQAGDPDTVSRLREYGPYLAPPQKREVNRRAGWAVFPENVD